MAVGRPLNAISLDMLGSVSAESSQPIKRRRLRWKSQLGVGWGHQLDGGDGSAAAVEHEAVEGAVEHEEATLADVESIEESIEETSIRRLPHGWRPRRTTRRRAWLQGLRQGSSCSLCSQRLLGVVSSQGVEGLQLRKFCERMASGCVLYFWIGTVGCLLSRLVAVPCV